MINQTEAIKRLKEINEQIELLTNEANEILEAFYLDQYTNKNVKNELKQTIENKGYEVKMTTRKRIRFWLISKQNLSKNILVLESNFREGKYNAWYTIKNDGFSLCDYIIFIYKTKNGTSSFVVLSKNELSEIGEKIGSASDSRTHFRFKATLDYVEEVQVSLDISESIGKLHKIF